MENIGVFIKKLKKTIIYKKCILDHSTMQKSNSFFIKILYFLFDIFYLTFFIFIDPTDFIRR